MADTSVNFAASGFTFEERRPSGAQAWLKRGAATPDPK
jgi:hypothetical protein